MKKRPTNTITFQPDPDVRRVLNDKLRGKEKKRGERTRLINEALILSLDKAAKLIAERDRQVELSRKRAKGE